MNYYILCCAILILTPYLLINYKIYTLSIRLTFITMAQLLIMGIVAVLTLISSNLSLSSFLFLLGITTSVFVSINIIIILCLWLYKKIK
jgi:hypothetical protein